MGHLLTTSVTSSRRVTVTRICALFQVASAHVTARYPNQHPILEGARDALIFGTDHLETPRYLGIRRIYKESGNNNGRDGWWVGQWCYSGLYLGC